MTQTTAEWRGVRRPPLLLRAAIRCQPALWLLALGRTAWAQAPVSVDFGSGEGGSYARLLLLFAALALAPAVLAVLTSFARIVIVLFFLRAGLGSNDIPPTVVIMGLAIFLTVFSMGGTIEGAYTHAVAPYLAGDVALETATEQFMEQLRGYMDSRTRPGDLAVFEQFSVARDRLQPVPMSTVVPAYIISELRAAFLIGFVIYLPFLVIDLVVGSTLASIGLLSLPAPAIALPFKVMMFVMVDGWTLLTHSLLTTIIVQ